MYPGTFAVTTPDKPAAVLHGTDQVLTFAELERDSTRLARHWYDVGLRRGDHVATLSVNALEVFVAYWAALRSGLYFTAINYHLTADDVAYILSDCAARALVASAPLADLATRAVEQVPRVQERICFGGRVDGFIDLRDVLASALDEPLRDQPLGADMLYSSGTTGRPKGVLPALPDIQVDDPNQPLPGAFRSMYSFSAEMVYLSPAPLYHAAPLRFCAWVQGSGGTVVVLPRFDPEAALGAIEEHRVTHSQWVPTMFVRMLKLPEEVRESVDLSSLRYAVHAAAPCPVAVKRAMIEWWGPILFEYYSSTEGNGVTFIDPTQWLEHPGSVGRAGLIGKSHICDASGAELPTGVDGTVYFERDQLPFRYHGDEAKTRAAQHPEHPTWTTTGDIGHLDQDGFLYLTDRAAFMIISGGVNIYPQEIENALVVHPEVLDAAVIGLPDEEMGERVHAVVQPVDGVTAGPELAERLTTYLRGNLAAYKVPRSIDFTDELPRTPTGKLVKRRLREKYVR